VGGEPPAGGEPAPTGVDAATLLPKLGEASTAFETKQTEAIQQEVFGELRTEFTKYFDALDQHPRTLVGQRVPSATGQGEEVLKDSQDARDWQEAIKQQLAQIAATRVDQKKEDMRQVFETVHSSIELFQNNLDLYPGTKQFDRELADAFVAAAEPYALKSNGKLIGYSVPVQPLVNALRAQFVATRAVKAAAPAAGAPAAPAATSTPTAQQQRAAEQPRTTLGTFAGPQAGIHSQAGQSATGEDDVAAGVLGAFLRQNGVTL
jgi:hypothetical protein